MAASSMAAPAPRWHYAWTITAVTFVSLLVAAGMRAAPSVLIVPIEQEFGWSRATLSFAIALQLLIYGLIGPFAAGLMDRFGIRKTMIAALALMALAFGATDLMTAPWQLLLLWGFGSGIGTGIMALILGAVVANRWFHSNRGLVMGILTGSAAAGQLIFLPLLAHLAVELGWRVAVGTSCACVLAIMPLVALLMRDRPAEMGLKPYGMPANMADDPPPSRTNPFAAAFAALGNAVGSRDFWLLSSSFFVCGASTFGIITTHFIPACLDHGIPEAAGAEILAGMGVLNIMGTMASGWLSDRFDNRYLLFWYYGLRGLSLLFLPYAFDLSIWGLSLFGIFYGLDWIATVPPTVRLTANVFGTQKSGVIYGWIMVMHQIGSAAAAYGGGLLRTWSGDYASSFLISGVLCVIAALLVLGIGRSRDRRETRPVLVTAEA